MATVDILQATYNLEQIQELVTPFLAPLQVQGKTVVLKPSLVSLALDPKSTLPTNTHKTITIGTAAALESLGAKKIHIVESETLVPARYALSISGLEPLIREKKLRRTRLTPLDETSMETIHLEDNIVIHYPRLIKQADFYITLPKFKTNVFSGLTLSVKNNLGLIPRADRFRYHSENRHPGLHELLARLYSVRPPDLSIMDAVVAGHRQGPTEATPFPLGIILIGNPLAVDRVLCEAAGYTPRHIQLLMDWKKIPADIELRGMLPQFNLELPQYTKNDGVKVWDCAACPAGCSGMVQSMRDIYAHYGSPLSKGSIIVGTYSQESMPPDPAKEGSTDPFVLFGDCAIRGWHDMGRQGGLEIPGCPPDYVVSLPAMEKAFGPNPWTRQNFRPDLALWTMLVRKLYCLLNGVPA